MTNLSKMNILLAMLLLFIIVLFSSNVIASELNDTISNVDTISGNHLEVVSPTYQKHYNSSLGKDIYEKILKNFISLSIGKKQFELKFYNSSSDGGDEGDGDDGFSDDPLDNYDDDDYYGHDYNGDNPDSGGDSGPSPAEVEAEEAIDEAESFWDSICDAISDAFSAVADAVSDIVDSIADAVSDAWDSFTEAIGIGNTNEEIADTKQEKSKEENNKANTNKIGQDPVNIATGTFFTSETDLSYRYLNFVVQVRRDYQSDRVGGGSFGPGWNFNYDTRIIMGVKPNAASEAADFEAKYQEVFHEYQEQQADYNANLDTLNNDILKAQTAQNIAAQFLNAAQNAVSKAEVSGNSSLQQEAAGILAQAQEKKGQADELYNKAVAAKQSLLAQSAQIESFYQTCQDLKALAEQSRHEADLAFANQARNAYIFSGTDPDHLIHTGNTTLTLVDESGTPHLYRIQTEPNYTSVVNYDNGGKNYYPNGAVTVSTLPNDDQVNILPDGGYQVVKKDKTQFLYSYYGQLTAIIDPNDNRLSFDYSGDHHLIRIVDGFGRELSFERHSGKIVKITDPKGRSFSYTYDSAGRLAGRTDPGGDTVSYVYNNGLLTEMVKPDGSGYKYEYNDLNGVKVTERVYDEEGYVERFSYNPGGKYSEYTNLAGSVERHYYNDRYLTTRIEYQDGSYVTMDYDAQNNLIGSTNEMGETYSYSYDQNRNLIRAIDPEGKSEQWSYNEFSKMSSHTDKMGNTTNYIYDAKGNLTAVNYPDGSNVAYVYNSRGQAIEVIDQLGQKTVYTYDQYGYANSITDPAGNVQTFQNEPIGNIVNFVDQAGNPIVYEYNNDNKIVSITDSLGFKETFAYNNRKDLVQYFDKNGQDTQYQYDKRHLLLKSTNPLGETVEYRYNPDGKPAERIINGVNHTVYTYDSRGKLIKERQVEIDTYRSFEYDRVGRLTAVIDPNGKITEYQYNGLGSLKQIRDAEGNRKYFYYNNNQKLTSIVDEQGNTTSFEYDPMNRLIRTTDPNQNTVQYQYDQKGNLIAVTDPNGNTTQYQYDPLGRLVKEIDPSNQIKTFRYDPRGLVIEAKNKNGHITSYEYDKLRRLVKVSDPLDGVRRYTYDPAGNLLSKTDANGVATTFQYDALNRLVSEKDALGNETKYQYNHLGLVTLKTDALNNQTHYQYDELGRLLQKVDPAGAAWNFEYDKNGNPVKETDPEGYSKIYQYDGLNRLVAAVDALNQKTAYQYDHRGNLLELTNHKGDSYRFEYDRAGRLIKETNYLGQAKTYTLDPNGNLTAKVDFNNNRTTYGYDKLNRLVETVFPDGTRKSFGYDPAGNMTSAVNDLVTEKFYYDELSRLVKAETIGLIENETKLVEFGYDKAGNTTFVTTKENGNPRKVSYTYDGLNRLAKVNLPDGGNVEFKYDALNRITERSNSNRTGTVYSYTPRGEVESIINYQDQRRGPDNVLSSYGYIYNAKGQRIFQVEGNGELTAYNYDPAGRIKEVYYPFTDAKKTEDLKERFYYGLVPDPQEHFKIRHRVPGLRYDEQESLEKQIREFTDSLMGKEENGNHKGNKHGNGKEIEIGCSHKRPFVSRLDIDYQNRNKIEELHRQIREGRGHLDLWKGFWKEEYDYDPNGNITQKRNGWGEIDYQYNPANQLTQVGNRTYQYDPNGNLTKEVLGKSFIDYQYNYENRLVKADDHVKHPLNHWKDAGDVSYGYDALGRRVKKEIDPERKKETEVEYYIYNGLGLNILAEYQIDLKKHGRHGVKGEIDRVKEYCYGNGFLLASQQIDEPNKHHYGRGNHQDISFYHHDVLRSVVMLTDKNGRVEERYQYDVWGKAYEGRFEASFPGKGHPNNTYGFTGQRYQPELGVYSFAYRDYCPRAMRWMTEDPVKSRANWFAYCLNDPLNFIDLLGLKEEPYDPNNPDHEPVNVDDINTKTPVVYDEDDEPVGGHPANDRAYNCHSFTFHDGQGDPTDPRNSDYLPNWDESPEDDLLENGYQQLGNDEPNKVGDVVINYYDENENEQWEQGEPIDHSGIVTKVDEEGNTVEVTSKLGEGGISTNHPSAPGFYEKHYDEETDKVYPNSHAYFRKDDDGKKTN